MLLVSGTRQILGVAQAPLLPPDPSLLEYFMFSKRAVMGLADGRAAYG